MESACFLSGQYETSLSEPVATRQLVMNTKKEQLSDERVRQALLADDASHRYRQKQKKHGDRFFCTGIKELAHFLLPHFQHHFRNFE